MSETTQKTQIAQNMLGIFSKKAEDVKVVDDTNSGGGNFFNPNAKDAPGQTYRAVIKFLPKLYDFDNPNKTETVETIQYYIKEGANKGVRYVSPKSIGKNEDCFVSDTYWAWKNSKDARLEKLAEELSYQRNTYALIQIIKDWQTPENNGKILLWNVPFAIQTLIKSLMYPSKEDIETGAVPNNVFNPITGIPMILKIGVKKTEVGEFRDYTECKFNDKLPTMMLLKGQEEQMKNEDIPTDETKLKELQNTILELILDGPSLEELEYKPANEATITRVKNALEVLEKGSVSTSQPNTTSTASESKSEVTEQPKEDKPAEKPQESKVDADTQSAEDVLNSIMGEQ